MAQRKSVACPYPAERATTSNLGNTFRIPKRKAPAESKCLQMESPLSRLKDGYSNKISWAQLTMKRRKLQGSCSSNCSEMHTTKASIDGVHSRPVLTDVHKKEHGQGDLNREKQSLAVKTQISGKKNDFPALHEVAEAHTCSEASTYTLRQRPFPSSSYSPSTVLKGFRPKRASDTLCQDENLQRGLSCLPPRRCNFKLKDPSLLITDRSLEWEKRWKSKVSPRNGTVKSPVSGDGDVFCSESLKEVEKPDRDALVSQQKGDVEISGELKRFGSILQQPDTEQDGDLTANCICPEKLGAAPVSTGLKSGSQLCLRPEVKKKLLSTSWHPHKSLVQRRNPRLRLQFSFSQSKKAESKPAEPIVLSSDEEEVYKGGSSGSVRPLKLKDGLSTQEACAEFVLEKQVEMKGAEKLLPGLSAKECSKSSKHLKEEPTLIELPFSALLTGKMKAMANGNITVTEGCVTIPLKDAEGDTEVSLALVPSELRGYGLWGRGTPAVPLFFLWISDALAQVVQRELSVLCPVDLPGQASPFILLKLTDALNVLQEALLASMMDMMGLHSGKLGLRQPLSRERVQALVRGAGSNSRLLALLRGDRSVTPDQPDHRSPTRQEKDQTGLRIGRTRSSALTVEDLAPSNRLILFPPPPLKGGIAVTTEDLQCLNNGEFLNDVIIDFYLKYLMLEKAPKAVVEKSHVFSSFFYKQLTRKDVPGEKVSSISAKNRRHHRVRTWTRNVDIFNKDYLFVPVNQEAHWYLVVICFPWLEEPLYEERGRSAIAGNCRVKRKSDSLAVEDRSLNSSSTTTSMYSKREMSLSAGDMERARDNSTHSLKELNSVPECTQLGCHRETVCKRPCILIMDSLKQSVHEKIFMLLREYLQVEWEVRKGSLRHFTAENMKGSHCRVPLQDNSSDCGIYLLQYAESFLQNPVVHFDLPIPLEQWFPRQQVRRKRDEIRELVLQLYRKQKGGC
ncbi:sentrin-specific protease 7-like isoform X1 [Arapaima gigas]